MAGAWLLLALITWEAAQVQFRSLVRGSAPSTPAAVHPNVGIEKGFLDFVVDAKRAGQEFPAILTRITRETTNIGKKLESAKGRTQDAAGDVVKVHKIASSTAREIDRYSAFLESNLDSLRQTSRTLTDSWIGYIEWFAPQTQAHRAELVEFRSLIRNLLESTKGSQKGVGAFRDSAAGVRRRRISQDMNRATDRLLRDLEGVIAVMKEIERACVKLLSLINKRL